jgi:hypothetical protein
MIAGLAVFSALAAVISARARAAGPALLFGIVAIALFTTTPLGSGLPDAIASIANFIGELADKLAGSSGKS